MSGHHALWWPGLWADEVAEVLRSLGGRPGGGTGIAVQVATGEHPLPTARLTLSRDGADRTDLARHLSAASGGWALLVDHDRHVGRYRRALAHAGRVTDHAVCTEDAPRDPELPQTLERDEAALVRQLHGGVPALGAPVAWVLPEPQAVDPATRWFVHVAGDARDIPAPEVHLRAVDARARTALEVASWVPDLLLGARLVTTLAGPGPEVPGVVLAMLRARGLSWRVLADPPQLSAGPPDDEGRLVAPGRFVAPSSTVIAHPTTQEAP